jgi:hypothetical protein
VDATVLILASTGVALTTGGLVVGTVDVIGRVRDYGDAVKAAPTVRIEDPRLRALSGLAPSNVANELAAETKARELAEQRLAAVAGASANLRRLWVSATVALVGVMFSGAADIAAALHAK